VRAAQPAHLRQAGDAGPHAVAFAVARDRALEEGHELGALGPRADEAELSGHDIDELRQLVGVRAAQQPAEARAARVVGRAEHGAGAGLGVGAHRAELQHAEDAAVAPDAALHEERRPGRVEHDEHPDDGQRRQQEQQQHRGQHEVETALGEARRAPRHHTPSSKPSRRRRKWPGAKSAARATAARGDSPPASDSKRRIAAVSAATARSVPSS